MPEIFRTRKIKNRFEVMSNPFYSIKKKMILEDQDTDHNNGSMTIGKAKDATGYNSIVGRWLKDKRYQESHWNHWNHGWTEEYCRYLDYLVTVNISYIATWPEKSHNMLVFETARRENPGNM